MKRIKRWIYLVAATHLIVAAVVVLAACAKPAPTQAPPVSDASVARGGQLYDKWWKVAEGATEPTADHALWAMQTTNKRSGADTQRCKECHGWDYQGKDGAYSKGSHFTGFPGPMSAGQTRTVDQLSSILSGSPNSQHDFSSVMGSQDITDLANFLKSGLVDDSKYIDYATKQAIGGDAARGKQRYDATCAACHGADGNQINFGSAEKPEYVGTVAQGNPWEFIHKVRAGQPGTAMPSAIVNGWAMQDVVDVLSYSQTLPAK